MQIKRAGGKVYGAVLTAAERKAMDIEINRQIAEADRRHTDEIDALILWLLHEKFGFGMKRLRRFYELFQTEFDALIKRYEMDDSDTVWLCTHKLKEYGLDIEQWNKEVKT